MSKEELPQSLNTLESPNFDIGQPVLIPKDQISERYKNRLKAVSEIPLNYFLVSMGVEMTDAGLIVPAQGFRDRLAAQGIKSQFESKVVAGKEVAYAGYLGLVRRGFFPVSIASPDFLVHDVVFHGVGFLGMNDPVGDLMKSAADRALLSQQPDAISKTVESIDGLSGTFLAGTILGNDITVDFQQHLSALAMVTGSSVPGESMGESTRAYAAAVRLAQVTPSMADEAIKYFSDVTTGLSRVA